MKDVKDLVYRFLTDADFFNMYKPRGTEPRGGGQTYIDFQTSVISVSRWHMFFTGVIGLKVGKGAQGPKWSFPVQSIGVTRRARQQMLLVYQRRTASVCISSQYIHSRNANRVYAWHPNNGFPQPTNPANRKQLPHGLSVFLARTYDNEVWAGWFNVNDSTKRICADSGARLLLNQMLAASRAPGDSGILPFKPLSYWA
jgi:5-methylcytosine-specific restriction protein A